MQSFCNTEADRFHPFRIWTFCPGLTLISWYSLNNGILSDSLTLCASRTLRNGTTPLSFYKPPARINRIESKIDETSDSIYGPPFYMYRVYVSLQHCNTTPWILSATYISSRSRTKLIKLRSSSMWTKKRKCEVFLRQCESEMQVTVLKKQKMTETMELYTYLQNTDLISEDAQKFELIQLTDFGRVKTMHKKKRPKYDNNSDHNNCTNNHFTT